MSTRAPSPSAAPRETPPEKLASHYTCHYCQLTHRKVEAGGMWHCPNVLCTGPGAGYWRSTLLSYREVKGGRHTVDHEEARVRGLAHAYTIAATEPGIAAAIRASAKQWHTDTEASHD